MSINNDEAREDLIVGGEEADAAASRFLFGDKFLDEYVCMYVCVCVCLY